MRFQLVTRGDKTRAVVSVPAEFAPSGTFYDKGRKAQVNISRCGVGPAAEAISFLRKGKSNDCVLYVASDPQHKAIEVPYKSMKAGIDLFLWNDDPPHPETIHTRFIFNDDGSITPSPTSPDVKDGDPLQFRLGKKKDSDVMILVHAKEQADQVLYFDLKEVRTCCPSSPQYEAMFVLTSS